MKVYTEKYDLKRAISKEKEGGNKIGLVPTMGALHEGHASIVRLALKQCDIVIVSIFVNPTQFDKKEDLEKYPRNLSADLEFLEKISEKVIVFSPSNDDLYEGIIKSESFDFQGLEKEMEGRFRTGHFDGVGTVVKKLLNIVKPDLAYFGEKDFQQLAIIRKLVEIEKMDVEIVGAPIFRENDGLAMSSRNVRLKPEYRLAAPFIYKTLQSVKERFGTESASSIKQWVENHFDKNSILKLEYFEIADDKSLKPILEKIDSDLNSYRAFIAVFADNIRLIDNIALN